MSMKKCPDCGEKYSDTYKKCPFCDEEQKLKKGKRVQKRPTKNGGRRAGTTDKENILTLILLVIMLVLAGILLWLLFGGGSSDDTPDNPSSGITSSTEKPGPDPGTSTPENPGTSTPQMPTDPVEDPKPLVPTADEIKLLPQTLKLNKEDYTTNVGDAAVQLRVGDGTGVYTWVSADPAIATVSETGKVTAIANGTIKVYATDGVGMGVCIVRVKGGSAPVKPDPSNPSTPTTPSDPSAANAKLNYTDVTISVGELLAMKVKNYDGEVTWSVKDSSIASILNDGTVKGLKSGRTDVVAKVGDRTLTCIIRVKNG
ncbi:MAG: hypothetical protein E7445_05875 [Ruminococcaceae bacterium]|nr:hypothetical protein [Oscillospiraceae bacterium]